MYGDDVFCNAVLSAGNFKERSWFSKNVMEPTEKFLRRNLGISGPEDYIKLYDGTIVPMSESGEQFAYSERITDCNFFLVTAALSVFKLTKANNLITLSTKTTLSSALDGTGEYGKVGGHHVHAKAAFKNDINYDPQKGFSISQEFMKRNKIDHGTVTNTQRKLFKELAESNRPNTLVEHTRIAHEALKAGGATEEMIDILITESLENLKLQGVTQPTNIPWYK